MTHLLYCSVWRVAHTIINTRPETQNLSTHTHNRLYILSNIGPCDPHRPVLIKHTKNRRAIQTSSRKKNSKFEQHRDCTANAFGDKLLQNSPNYTNYGEWQRGKNPNSTLPEVIIYCTENAFMDSHWAGEPTTEANVFTVVAGCNYCPLCALPFTLSMQKHITNKENTQANWISVVCCTHNMYPKKHVTYINACGKQCTSNAFLCDVLTNLLSLRRRCRICCYVRCEFPPHIHPHSTHAVAERRWYTSMAYTRNEEQMVTRKAT